MKKRPSRRADRRADRLVDPLETQVQMMFLADLVHPDVIDNPVVMYILADIRSRPIPDDPL
jgi:hypothetical protein